MPDAVTTAATTTAATTTTTTAAANWYDGKGLDSEHIAHIQSKGWDKDVNLAALEAVKAHRATEKFVGVPADELVRIPKGANGADWSKVWEKMGVPTDPAKYEFAGLKVGAEDLKADVMDTFRKVAADAHLSVEAAKQMADTFVKKINADVTAATAEKTAALATEKETLKTNWGVNYAIHELTARRAAEALGVDAQAIGALEQAVGYAKVMEMFRNIGSKIGEDKFVTGSSGNRDGLMTVDQAMARKNELTGIHGDKAWQDRYLNGGAAERREMEALNKILVGAGRV